MKKILLSLFIVLNSLNADVFDKGNIAVGILAGGGTITTKEGDKSYTLLGGNVDYFFINNLSIGLGYTQWFGSDPNISQVTVPLNYYYPLSEQWKPYVGTFYRHTSIGTPFKDFNSFGVKAGAVVQISKRAYLGAGWVQEYYDECTNFNECSSGYPELTAIFTF
jgi:hypothetical protein